MILLCGIPSETPLAMVAEALDQLGEAYRFVNQRAVAAYRIEWRLERGEVAGQLALGDETFDLAGVRGVYLRLMDHRLLPELENAPPGSTALRHAWSFHEALFRWAEVTPARVVNRAEPQGSNGSKPYQAQLIARFGLRIPETLVTNDPEAVLAFRAKHGQIIFKSLSAVRSIVRPLSEDDVARLDLIRWCPVQFQEMLTGTDVRVHVVGNEVFATEIVSSHVDYRYARHEGGVAELRPHDLPIAMAERCLELVSGLGLAFAGIDFKRTSGDVYYCLEVNPSPAFSYYQANTGQPIAAALARHLTGLTLGS
jgi:glutathione synthase/RimK-type ligase-like ATP-grasp enzyme